MTMPSRGQWLALGLAALAGVLGTLFFLRPAYIHADPPPPPSGAHYTVVFTEGHNLCVTDNRNSKLYFYTVDPEKGPGADLKLRGTVDLTQVGKPVIKPTLTKKKDG
jgi:hypothetical protein